MIFRYVFTPRTYFPTYGTVSKVPLSSREFCTFFYKKIPLFLEFLHSGYTEKFGIKYRNRSVLQSVQQRLYDRNDTPGIITQPAADLLDCSRVLLVVEFVVNFNFGNYDFFKSDVTLADEARPSAWKKWESVPARENRILGIRIFEYFGMVWICLAFVEVAKISNRKA